MDGTCLFSSLSILMTNILHFLTTISEMRFGSISFLLCFYSRHKQQKRRRGQCIHVYLYILFHKGKRLRDYNTSKSIFSHHPE